VAPTPPFALAGHTALLTGSARGLGLGMARGLATAGARVILNGRDPGRLGQAAQLLRDEALAVDTCPFDVTDAVAAGQVFVPMHYAEANRLTFPAFDPYSRHHRRLSHLRVCRHNPVCPGE